MLQKETDGSMGRLVNPLPSQDRNDRKNGQEIALGQKGKQPSRIKASQVVFAYAPAHPSSELSPCLVLMQRKLTWTVAGNFSRCTSSYLRTYSVLVALSESCTAFIFSR